ncbi:hypothetical protein HD553DRAFT_322522 [Filobasidium floriforme]|uniref:uncharacterized protein n=1 Tax=Filobasidium floriforme TaxID=5210 RepID=UPI001E8D1305|nr:uncharacterized protein HD553DRAFT_322522 [Filobasidium floriforme]KAH8087987.1 hypothetical protein HD553DRAFT_322522 [Filobasidium floriforme]
MIVHMTCTMGGMMILCQLDNAPALPMTQVLNFDRRSDIQPALGVQRFAVRAPSGMENLPETRQKLSGTRQRNSTIRDVFVRGIHPLDDNVVYTHITLSMEALLAQLQAQGVVESPFVEEEWKLPNVNTPIIDLTTSSPIDFPLYDPIPLPDEEEETELDIECIPSPLAAVQDLYQLADEITDINLPFDLPDQPSSDDFHPHCYPYCSHRRCQSAWQTEWLCCTQGQYS